MTFSYFYAYVPCESWTQPVLISFSAVLAASLAVGGATPRVSSTSYCLKAFVVTRGNTGSSGRRLRASLSQTQDGVVVNSTVTYDNSVFSAAAIAAAAAQAALPATSSTFNPAAYVTALGSAFVSLTATAAPPPPAGPAGDYVWIAPLVSCVVVGLAAFVLLTVYLIRHRSSEMQRVDGASFVRGAASSPSDPANSRGIIEKPELRYWISDDSEPVKITY